MSIRAVCFDLGGVVARISFHLAEMAERAGVHVTRSIPRDEDIHSMHEFAAYQAGELSDHEYLDGLARYLGVSLEDAMRVHCSMLIEPFPGIIEIVQELNDDGVITGCLSNTNAPHWHELAESGRFPAVLAMRIRLASHEIDAAKPDPRAFHAFAAASRCESSEIVLFDDSQANCDSAAQLGWTTFRIGHESDPASQIRDHLATLGL